MTLSENYDAARDSHFSATTNQSAAYFAVASAVAASLAADRFALDAYSVDVESARLAAESAKDLVAVKNQDLDLANALLVIAKANLDSSFLALQEG